MQVILKSARSGPITQFQLNVLSEIIKSLLECSICHFQFRSFHQCKYCYNFQTMIRQLVELYSCRNKFPVGSSGASGVAASATKFFEVTISASISIMQEEIEANLRTGPLLFTRCKTWNVYKTRKIQRGQHLAIYILQLQK
ncbi:Hypothetical_protein [Hexamita inflata]|uniref:Hypothetical_protein n=1 Tax=Hexamita inflata TaxID=28002 RepID=A0ABP1KLC3_9EUKA